MLGALYDAITAPVYMVCAVIAQFITSPISSLARPFADLGSSIFMLRSTPHAPGSSGSPGSAEEDATFRAAAARVSEHGAHLSTEVRLRLYALYKQSTLGDAPASPTGRLLDTTAQVKWRSWAGLRGMGRADAMRLYSNMVAQEIGLGDTPPSDDIWDDDEQEAIDGLPAEMLDMVPHPRLESSQPLNHPSRATLTREPLPGHAAYLLTIGHSVGPRRPSSPRALRGP